MPEPDPARQAAEKQLQRDLDSIPIQVGVIRGYWTIERLEWPFLFVTISGPTEKVNGGRVWLRLEVDGYPGIPSATPWDEELGEQLAAEKRPTGGRATTTFRTDWEEGRALYLPVDRVAVTTHADWPQTYAAELWDPAKGLVQLLDLVHHILNEEADALAVDAA